MMTFLHRPLLILALALPPLGAQPTRLELGKTVEAELGAGQTHQYVVTMSEGQFARVVVSRPGFDTVLRLSRAAGPEKLLELHWPGAAQRPAALRWIAKSAGEYLVELTTNTEDVTAGKYDIRLTEIRNQEPDDEKQVAIQLSLETAQALKNKYEYQSSNRRT